MDKFNKMKEGGVLKYGDGKKVDPAILEHMKRQGIVLPSPKNEQVSADNRTKELKEAQQRDIKTRQLGNNLKQFGTDTRNQLGTILSFTNPSFGLALGLGDAAIAATNGNYIEGGVQAGLEVLPFVGKTVSKGIKLIPKRNILSKQFIKDLNNATNIKDYATMGKQNQTFQEGIDEVTQMWNGSTDMSNFTINGSNINPRGKYILHPDIAKRAKKAQIPITATHSENGIGTNVSSNYGLYDNLGNNNHVYKGNPNFKEIANKFKEGEKTIGEEASGIHYGNDLEGYNIVVKRRNSNGTLRTPQEVKETAAHEATHRMQEDFGISLNESEFTNVSKYPRVDVDSKIGKVLDKYLDKNPWSRSADELQANLWKYRVRHKIGTRDLTDDEAIEFFMEFGDKHFKNSTLISNNKELIDAIKAIPVVTGIGVGINNIKK